jgi:hypothetical protein
MLEMQLIEYSEERSTRHKDVFETPRLVLFIWP